MEYNSIFNGKSILTETGEMYTLSNINYIGGGRSGDVFKVSESIAVKIYNENPLKPELCEKLKTLSALFNNKKDFIYNVVVPNKMVYFKEDTVASPCGFTMKYLPNAKPLTEIRWKPTLNIEEEQIFDQTIANILFEICEALKELHRNRIYLGDLKPSNILISELSPFIVDFDSCSMPSYPGETYTIQYLDPLIRDGIPNAIGKNEEFSSSSDWWALAVISFQLFIGVLPWSGIHSKMMKEPLAVRSFNYSAVYLDPMVRPHQENTRPKTWLEQRPRLKSFFERIFSRNKNARIAISEVLEFYYQKESFAKSNFKQIDIIINSLIKDVNTDDYLREVLDKIMSNAKNKVIASNLTKQKLLDIMYNP